MSSFSFLFQKLRMARNVQLKAYAFLALVCVSTITPAFAAPNTGRKFAVKSNSPKKVYHKNILPSKENIDRADRDREQIQTPMMVITSTTFHF